MYNENELNKDVIDKNIECHINEIKNEFKNGFEFIKKYPKTVTFFGSSRLTPDSSYYHEAYKLSKAITEQLGYGIITGGGPGIMEAANKGAFDAMGKSIGLNINIRTEQHTNDYTRDSIEFNYFFVRKAILNFAAEAYVFFPGGYGTFDELFGVLTLIQTNKIPKIPVILFGNEFWNPLVDVFKDSLLNKHHTIKEEDLDLFIVTNSIDTVIEKIKGAPVSTWWKMID